MERVLKLVGKEHRREQEHALHQNMEEKHAMELLRKQNLAKSRNVLLSLLLPQRPLLHHQIRVVNHQFHLVAVNLLVVNVGVSSLLEPRDHKYVVMPTTIVDNTTHCPRIQRVHHLQSSKVLEK